MAKHITIKPIKKNSQKLPPTVRLDSMIRSIRGEKVILAADLARIYGVETRVLNQAVKRNRDKFPDDFMFKLTRKEAEELLQSRSQSVILKRGQNIKYLPSAFTEHGVIMAANVLNSPHASHMSIFVVRAFIKMRQELMANTSMIERPHELESKLTQRLDSHEQVIVYVLGELRKLTEPPVVSEPKRRPIGFRRED